jgi:spermidine/putrescine transport system permease protein
VGARLAQRSLYVYAGLVVLFMWLPILGVLLASFNQSRFFSFPFDEWTTQWYGEARESTTVQDLFATSLQIALTVAVLATLIGFTGAMAFARYRWRGRAFFQRFIILPLFLPQMVLGLALRLWFNYADVLPDWRTAVFAHLVWIVPVTTLVIAIGAYGLDPELEAAANDLGSGRVRTFFEITLPPLLPAVRSAAIFAFLLSWLNFPLSFFTSGAESTVPEWIFAKQVGGYTPLLPSVGILAIAVPLVLVTGAFVALRLVRLARGAIVAR